MKTEIIEIDSQVFGRNVLSLQNLTLDDDLKAEELRYLSDFDPAYVSCRIPMEDLKTIHRLEQLGFKFIECQIRSVINFKQDYDVARYPYQYQLVTKSDVLNDVLEIAGSTIVHDRFSMDYAVPLGISKERYRRYVHQSFESPVEEVWRLYDPTTNFTLAFRTHRHTAHREVLLLLGGVHPDFKTLGLGVISSFFCFNQMRRDGIRKALTHISAINYPVFNLEIGYLGFRVLDTFAVMRKIYS